MVAGKSRSFSERIFLNLVKKTKADMNLFKKLENFSQLYKKIFFHPTNIKKISAFQYKHEKSIARWAKTSSRK